MSEAKGWVNEDGFKSLRVHIHSAKLDNKDIKSIYCSVSVGTQQFKTEAVNVNAEAEWKPIPYAFELNETTQSIEVEVNFSRLLKPDKHVATLTLPIVAILQSKGEATEHVLAAAISKKKVTGPESDGKTVGKIVIQTTLSKEDAAGAEVGKASTGKTGTPADFIRRKVSKKKKRFQKDGFDLDLAYITPRLMAMGYPSVKLEGVYRNPLDVMLKFLNQRHKGAYKIYNLCSERAYDANLFEGRVARFPFDDHNACYFPLIHSFCLDVHEWLSKLPQNIAAVHCKAGKGRTGLMIACYMIFSGLHPEATNSLRYYAGQRTFNFSGVTIPSQIRYVHYYQKYLEHLKNPSFPPIHKHAVTLKSISICAVKKTDTEYSFKLDNIRQQDKMTEYNLDSWVRSVEGSNVTYTQEGKDTNPIELVNDVRCFVKTKKGKVTQLWFNTRFLAREKGTINLILGKKELDKVCKDKKHKNFSENFRVVLEFNDWECPKTEYSFEENQDDIDRSAMEKVKAKNLKLVAMASTDGELMSDFLGEQPSPKNNNDESDESTERDEANTTDEEGKDATTSVDAV